MIQRIHQLPNGSLIDLKRVVSIKAIDKDPAGNLFIPVVYERSAKPVKYVVGFSIGETPPETKTKVLLTFQVLTNAWVNYLNQQP